MSMRNKPGQAKIADEKAVDEVADEGVTNAQVLASPECYHPDDVARATAETAPVEEVVEEAAAETVAETVEDPDT